MSDELKNFKVRDAAPKVPGRPRGTPSAEGTPSVGFPRIEALVESDQPDLEGLRARREALEALAKNGPAKERAPARKAAIAYERTEGLLDQLFATKQKLQGSGG